MSFFWNNGAFYAIDDKTVGKEQKRTLKRKEGKKLTKSCFVQPDDEKKNTTRFNAIDIIRYNVNLINKY